MEIILIRYCYSRWGIMGALYIDGLCICHTCEHPDRHLSVGKYDSVYIDRWQRIERKADTVFYDRVKTEFRYRLLRDTVYKTRTDTIPVVRQVPVIRKERYTPPSTKFLACLGIIALGASVIVLLGKKLRS